MSWSSVTLLVFFLKSIRSAHSREMKTIVYLTSDSESGVVEIVDGPFGN